MRFKVFVSLLLITLVLDSALLSLSLLRPGARVFELPVALAAEPPAPAAPPTATATPTMPPTRTPAPSATHTPAPTATASPTATVEPTATPTAAPAAQLLAAKSVSFTPSDRAVRANIRLALEHY